MARLAICLVGLVLLCAASAKATGYMMYKDPKHPVNARVRDLVKRMTLEEKIGQMTQIILQVATADVMKKYNIGSMMGGGGNASAQTWINMVNDFQKGSLSIRLRIPLIYGIDAFHGHNLFYKSTIFPHNVGLGATRDPALVKRIEAATALEVRTTGIQYTFGPCVALINTLEPCPGKLPCEAIVAELNIGDTLATLPEARVRGSGMLKGQ